MVEEVGGKRRMEGIRPGGAFGALTWQPRLFFCLSLYSYSHGWHSDLFSHSIPQSSCCLSQAYLICGVDNNCLFLSGQAVSPVTNVSLCYKSLINSVNCSSQSSSSSKNWGLPHLRWDSSQVVIHEGWHLTGPEERSTLFRREKRNKHLDARESRLSACVDLEYNKESLVLPRLAKNIRMAE